MIHSGARGQLYVGQPVGSTVCVEVGQPQAPPGAVVMGPWAAAMLEDVSWIGELRGYTRSAFRVTGTRY